MGRIGGGPAQHQDAVDRRRRGAHAVMAAEQQARLGHLLRRVVGDIDGGGEGPGASDLAAGGAGLVLGVAGSQLLALGAEAIDEDLLTRVQITPLPLASAYGLAALGVW